jgi:hypothetical protein
MPLRYPAPDAANSGGRLPPSRTFRTGGYSIIIVFLNTLGLVLLIAAAKAMSRDNTIGLLPAVDPPPGRGHHDRPLRSPGAGSSRSGAVSPSQKERMSP